MKKFDYAHKCAKCGFGEKDVGYHESWCSCRASFLYQKEFDIDSHLHIRCKLCGYEWPELPLDAEEGES